MNAAWKGLIEDYFRSLLNSFCRHFQEECRKGGSFREQIFVLCKVTKRPEALKYGTSKLVGLDEKEIYLTAKRTVQIIRNYFGISDVKIKEFIM
jgi:UDP-N-acetylglucosamine 2-epimerase